MSSDDTPDPVGCLLGDALLFLARQAAERWAVGDEADAERLWRGAIRLRGDAEFVDGVPRTTPDDGQVQ